MENKLIDALQDELVALETWKNAKGLPKDVKAGIEISIDKLTVALSDAGFVAIPRRGKRWVLKKSTIKKIIAMIEDGDVEEAVSALDLLKRSHPYGLPGRSLYKAHEEVSIGAPEKAVHWLESLSF